jgi:hypothetical protein
MLSFQGLSLLLYALSRDATLAVGAPLVILYSRAAEHGTTYPIVLMGTNHTYGAVGLSLILLCVAFLAAGWYRLGGFLVGLAPAVHPSLGSWLALIVASCVIWDVRGQRAELRRALPFFLAGCAATALSLLTQQMMAGAIEEVEPSVTAHYVAGFIKGWDEHRRPVAVVSMSSLLNAAALTIALVWLKGFPARLPRPTVLALRAIVAAAASSLLLMFVSWIPTDIVPSPLLLLMPSRYLNFNVLAFAPLLLGLLAFRRSSLLCQFAILAILAALFINARSMLWQTTLGTTSLADLPRLDPGLVFVAAFMAVVGAGVVRATWSWRREAVAAWIPRTASLALVAAAAVLLWRLPPSPPLLDRTNDPIFEAAASERQGLMLTSGSFHLVQLYTRRPVLIDSGALDTLIYAPEGGPVMDRILRGAYDIDFFNPPPDVRRSAWIPHSFNEPTWEGFSRERWREIGRSFNVTQVMTRASYALDLPIVREDDRFKLYRIPANEESDARR